MRLPLLLLLKPTASGSIESWFNANFMLLLFWRSQRSMSKNPPDLRGTKVAEEFAWESALPCLERAGIILGTLHKV